MGLSLHKKRFDELTTQEMKDINFMPGARFGGNPDTVEF